MPVARTSVGQLRGRTSERGLAFLGIPYSAAPRWAPPEVVAPWTGIRDAIAPGPAAPQPTRMVATFTHGEIAVTDEECLYLNVFTPSLDGTRPVFVWVHGGGFAIGHGAAGLYDGALLASESDLVVVTLNYRLGSLGWLGHPDLAAEPGAPSANWGLQDQIAALEWVRQNIDAFGGDPARVTLGGQSAGALTAMDLLAAPAAHGLFQRLVLASPPLGDLAQPPEVAVRWAEALSAASGGAGAFDAGRLRATTADAIVATHEALLDEPAWRGTRGGALPTLDPATLPASPVDLPAASPYVDVLVGHTADEGTFFFRSPWRPSPPPERISGIVSHLCHTDAPQDVIDDYRQRAVGRGEPTDDVSVLVAIATEAMIAGPAAAWAATRAEAVGGRSHVFRYRVDHPGAGPELGATHTVEVPLVFGTYADGGAGERLGGQAPGTEPVAGEFRAGWTQFIHDGDPGWAADEPAVFG